MPRRTHLNPSSPVSPAAALAACDTNPFRQLEESTSSSAAVFPSGTSMTTAAEDDERATEAHRSRRHSISSNRSSLRRSRSTRVSLVSDTGLLLHEQPSSGLFSIALIILSSTIGAGVLSLSRSLAAQASLVPGLIICVLWWCISVFSSYVLSLSSEYSEIYSQPQLLVRTIVGDLDTSGFLDLSTDAAGANDESDVAGSDIGEPKCDDHGTSSGGISSPAPVAPPVDVQQQRQQQKLSAAAAAVGWQNDETDLEGDQDEDEERSQLLDKRDVEEKINKNDDGDDCVNDPVEAAVQSMAVEDAEQFPRRRRLRVSKQELSAAVAVADRSRRELCLFVDILLCATYYLYVCAYSRICVDSSVDIIASWSLSNTVVLGERWFWCLLYGAIFVVICCKRVFAELQIVALLGVATIVFAVGAIFARVFIPGPSRMADDAAAAAVSGKASSGSPHADQQQHYEYFKISAGIFSASSTFCSAFSWQILAPPLYSELEPASRSPSKFQRAAVSAMLFAVLLYLVAGVSGFVLFGDQCAGNIIQNFATTDRLMSVVRLALVAHFAAVTPIQAVTSRQCLHRSLLRLGAMLGAGGEEMAKRADDPNESLTMPLWALVGETVGLIVSAVVVAESLADAGDAIAMSGAIGGTASAAIFPAIIGFFVLHEIESREGTGEGPTGEALYETDNALFLPFSLSDLGLNNLLGFVSWRPSWKTLRRGCVVIGVIGVSCSVGSIVTTLHSMSNGVEVANDV